MATKTMKTIRHKDVNTFKALARTNLMTADQLKELGLTNNRIKQMAKDKYLKQICYTDKQGNSFHIFCLGSKGEKYCNSVLGINSFYASIGQHHDLLLSREYLKLTEKERESVKTENEWRAELKNQIREVQDRARDESRSQQEREQDEALYKQLCEQMQNREISTVDMTYVRESDGVEVAIEIVTGNYTEQEIQAKMTFAETMKLELVLVRN